MAVLVVVLGVVRLVDLAGTGVGGSGGSGGGSGDEPPVLRLSGWIPPADEDQPEPGYLLGVLVGELPEGPATGRVHPLGDVSGGGDPAALAAALGLPGDGEDQGGVRSWVDGPRQLVVNTADGSWTFQPAAGVEGVTGEGVVGDAVTGEADTGTTAGSPPDRSLARSVVEAAGLDPDDGVEALTGSSLNLTVDPVVAGLPTAGLTTSVTVDGPTVVSGQGWLAGPEAPDGSGATYPLISARDAWDTLLRTPRPMTLMACPESQDGSDPSGCGGGPVTVTGARPGLSLQWSAGVALLVPSWLFAVEGSPAPLVQVAVDRQYLEVNDSSAGGGVGGSVGSGGSVGGSVGTVTPEPGGQVQPDQPASQFTSVTAGADGRSLEVTFWGGVEDCYTYTVSVSETEDAIELTRRERVRDGAQVCIELAQEYRRTVTLDAPLGSRPVVDAETGETLLNR